MNPPNYFNAQERAIWREIIKAAPAPLTDADRPALEILVIILHKQRTRAELSTNERSTLLKLLMEFHCTPHSRSRNSRTDPLAENEFATV